MSGKFEKFASLNRERYSMSNSIIPGGTQLFSKRPEIFSPTDWPTYYSKANGITITDMHGQKFRDMSQMGVGSCILGYADPFVNKRVKKIIDAGVQSTLIAAEEMELAEVLVDLHPWANMVRYARSGGEAMSLAVRIARAASGKDVVAFSGYHGWNDWYLAANLSDANALDSHLLPGLSTSGVPSALKGTSVGFEFNKIEEFRKILDLHEGHLAAVVMEPRRSDPPLPGYLEEIRDICNKSGIVLIFDEITTGWRGNPGGIHLQGSVMPDLAVFAKSMANGFAMSAVIGTTDVMQYAAATFMSSTNWTERVGPAAALATIHKYDKYSVHHYLSDFGNKVTAGWIQAAKENGLNIDAENNGLPALSHFSFQNQFSRGMSVIFTNRMLKLGWLAHTQFKPSFAHDEKVISNYLQDVNLVFGELSKMLRQGDPILESISSQNPSPSIPRLTK
jgi:glutamate-1-semialdehyde aminotransferase